jgi:hypothetical protein
MSIEAAANFNLLFYGDGTSTVLNIDLDEITFTDGTSTSVENILRPKNLPIDGAGITVDGSSTGFTTSISGTVLTVTFTTAPNANQHNIRGNIRFASF